MPVLCSEKIKENRNNLIARILQNSIPMPNCSFCYCDPCQVYTMSLDSDCCLEYVKHKKTQCDVWGPTTQQQAVLEHEEQKLEDKQEAAQESQRKLLEHLSQSQAKLQQLNKQRKLLKTRVAEMLCRGLKSLDELDALEQKEKEEAEKQS